MESRFFVMGKIMGYRKLRGHSVTSVKTGFWNGTLCSLIEGAGNCISVRSHARVSLFEGMRKRLNTF